MSQQQGNVSLIATSIGTVHDTTIRQAWIGQTDNFTIFTSAFVDVNAIFHKLLIVHIHWPSIPMPNFRCNMKSPLSWEQLEEIKIN